MVYLSLKVLHIFFVTAWMAVLFYLPRLFVYHTKNLSVSETSSTFKVMEAKLMGVIGNLACIIVWVTGFSLSLIQGFEWWLVLKIILVITMTIFHLYLSLTVRVFAEDGFVKTERFYRIINEIPTILLFMILILVVFQPALFK